MASHAGALVGVMYKVVSSTLDTSMAGMPMGEGCPVKYRLLDRPGTMMQNQMSLFDFAASS